MPPLTRAGVQHDDQGDEQFSGAVQARIWRVHNGQRRGSRVWSHIWQRKGCRVWTEYSRSPWAFGVVESRVGLW